MALFSTKERLEKGLKKSLFKIYSNKSKLVMFIKDYFFYTEIFILGNSLIIEGQMHAARVSMSKLLAFAEPFCIIRQMERK